MANDKEVNVNDKWAEHFFVSKMIWRFVSQKISNKKLVAVDKIKEVLALNKSVYLVCVYYIWVELWWLASGKDAYEGFKEDWNNIDFRNYSTNSRFYDDTAKR